MTIIRRFVGDGIQVLGDREFKGIAATSDLQLDGYALDMAGANLSRFASGKGPLLDNHNPTNIIGVITSIRTTATNMPFSARFSSNGVSELADQRCRELKDGIVNSFSIGFDVEKAEPIRGASPGSMRATKWTLLEISTANVPMDPKAVVTERARRNMNAITKAQLAADTAMDEHRAAGRHHTAMGEALDRLDDHRRQVGSHLRAFKQALEAADPTQARECHERCRRALDGLNRELRAIGDRHGDAMDSHSALTRAVREAGSLLDSSSAEIQTSGGVSDEDSSRSARRQRDLERLRHPEWEDMDSQRRKREIDILALALPPE